MSLTRIRVFLCISNVFGSTELFFLNVMLFLWRYPALFSRKVTIVEFDSKSKCFLLFSGKKCHLQKASLKKSASGNVRNTKIPFSGTLTVPHPNVFCHN